MVMLELSNFLHFLGLAFGLGGATIAIIISSKADKDKEIGSAFMKIMPSISRLIIIGWFLLLISGVGLIFFVKWPLNKQLLIIKHILVAWIIIIGIFLGKRMNRMKILAPKGKEKPSSEFIRTKSQIKSLSYINLFLWYVITLVSVFV